MIDLKTGKTFVEIVIKVMKNEEIRNNVILLLIVIIAISFLIVILPAYIIFNPIESFKSFFSEDEQVIVQNVKNGYFYNLEKGKITINGKLGFPLEHIENVVITAEYGMYDPWKTGNYTKHTGIDLSGLHRDNVLAVEKGIVIFAGTQNGYGNCIELKHNIDGVELYTFYAHLSSILVEEGQEVEQGYIIGKEGGDPYTDTNAGNSTGHHLHFEVRKSKDYGNDVNPKEFIY